MSEKTRYKQADRVRDEHEAEHRGRSFWERWKGTDEGRLFKLGLIGIGVLAAEITIVFLIDQRMAWGLVQMVATENFAGREGAIGLALNRGAPPWLTAQVSATQDLVVVALAFPVFLHLLAKYHDRDNIVMRRLRKVEAAADRHRKVADRWGAIGIYVFMVIPFLVNGPLVGAVAGRLAGMTRHAIVLPVILATVTAAFAWSYGLDALQDFMKQFHDKLPIFLTMAILSVVVLVMFVMEWRDARTRAESI